MRLLAFLDLGGTPFSPQSPFPIRGANEGGIEQNRSPLNALVL